MPESPPRAPLPPRRTGPQPDRGELAGHTDISQDEVVAAQVAAGGYDARSTDAPPVDDERDGGTWEKRTGCDAPGFAGVEDLATLKPLPARLPEREQHLLALRFSA